MILKTSHSAAPSNDTSSCQRRPWPAKQKCLSLFLSHSRLPNELVGEHSRAELHSTFSPWLNAVSLLLNIFSPLLRVYSVWVRPLLWTSHNVCLCVFNQDQITESCLHRWAHPQKLGDECACLHDAVLWWSQQNVPKHIFLCEILVQRQGIGLRYVSVLLIRSHEVTVLCYTWCHHDLIMSASLLLLLAVSFPWRLCYHLYSIYFWLWSSSAVHYTCIHS